MLRCLIVDDEHLARALLEDYASKLPQLELVGSCAGAFEAMELMQQQAVDLLFCDIQMPELRGTDFIKTLATKPMVIFTTAYADYAVESYELQAVDYLLKPIAFERFALAVSKAGQRWRKEQTPPARPNHEESFLLVKADHGMHKVPYEDIIYFSGEREYVGIHLRNGRKLLALLSLNRLEAELPDRFLRIHRSYIVQHGLVSSLVGNQVKLPEELLLPVGKSYKEAVLKRIFYPGE